MTANSLCVSVANIRASSIPARDAAVGNQTTTKENRRGEDRDDERGVTCVRKGEREGSVNYVLTLEGITFATELARYGSWMKQMKPDTACGEPPLGSV